MDEQRWDYVSSEVVVYNPSQGVERPQDADLRLRPKRVPARRTEPVRLRPSNPNSWWGM